MESAQALKRKDEVARPSDTKAIKDEKDVKDVRDVKDVKVKVEGSGGSQKEKKRKVHDDGHLPPEKKKKKNRDKDGVKTLESASPVVPADLRGPIVAGKGHSGRPSMTPNGANGIQSERAIPPPPSSMPPPLPPPPAPPRIPGPPPAAARKPEDVLFVKKKKKVGLSGVSLVSILTIRSRWVPVREVQVLDHQMVRESGQPSQISYKAGADERESGAPEAGGEGHVVARVYQQFISIRSPIVHSTVYASTTCFQLSRHQDELLGFASASFSSILSPLVLLALSASLSRSFRRVRAAR